MMSYNPGLEAATKWKEDYADLRLSYDRSALDAALLAFVRTEMAGDTVGADEESLYVMLCIAFVKLAQRGAIAPIRPLSTEGERQLAELKAGFNVVPGDLRPKEPELSLVEQVAQDFNQNKVPMSEIRRRRRDPLYEATYVEALEKDLIQ
jgi:hypothetical protein